jgi:hypothetical protein
MRSSILTIIIFLFLTNAIYSQSKEVKKSLSVKTGFASNIIMNGYGDSWGRNFYYLGYAAPSFGIKNNEFYFGALITGRKDINKTKISIGIVAGYNYNFFSELKRVNWFLHFGFEFIPNKFYTINSHPNNQVQSHADYYNIVIGPGINLFLDKKNKFGFYSIIGYNSSYCSTDYYTSGFYGLQFEINLGFFYKFNSDHKKL